MFLFASAILVLGVGTSVSQIACEVGIWWCILLYATSKVLIYSQARHPVRSSRAARVS
jgi:hypothetical protein